MTTSASGPRVTVLLSAYNEADHIADAIEGVLSQSFDDLELLIIDDGSTDDTLTIARSYSDPRIRVLTQENQGKAVALNLGLDHARGEFVAIQDGDDRSYPGRLAAQVAAFDDDPELGAVFCRHELLVDGRAQSARVRGADRDECERLMSRLRNPAFDPTIMFRREATAHIRFEPELRVGQGEDHLLRIGEEFPIMVVPGCHYGYRVHDGNSSTSSIERQAHYRDAVRRRAFERRQEDWWVQPRLGLMLRPERMTRMTGHAVESAVELTAIGLRGRAIRDSAQHLRGIWRYRDSWVPLIYSLMPRALLRRKRPGIDALRAERDQLRTMLP